MNGWYNNSNQQYHHISSTIGPQIEPPYEPTTSPQIEPTYEPPIGPQIKRRGNYYLLLLSQ